MARRTPIEVQSLLASLWYEFKSRGSRAARDRIIQHYNYLVTKTRTRIVPSVPVRIAPEDLEMEGYIALVKAVDQFDPRRKVKFESYAISMVRGAMLEYLRREDWVPRSVRSKQKTLQRAEDELTLHKGPQQVTPAALAEHLSLPIDEFFQLYAEANILQMVSLEDVVGDSEHEDLDPLVVLESVRSREPAPDNQAIGESQRDMMIKCISWLPLQERTVVLLYYYEGWTLKQVAKQLDRSESRAHQLHAQAIERLGGYINRQRGLYLSEKAEAALDARDAENPPAEPRPRGRGRTAKKRELVTA
jgi:RNA polymerase sigma factor for flagellar operon FliA